MKFQISGFRFQIAVALAAFALAVAPATAQEQRHQAARRDRLTSTSATVSSTTGRSRAIARGSTATSTPSRRRTSTGRPRDEQIAFWLNAYNALVLQTVIDHYPDSAAIDEYPARSIRQIPGAFERLHAPGRRPDADARSDRADHPAEFDDPRSVFALGRGAVGSGRLRSEAYTAAALERQLDRGRQRVRHAGRVRRHRSAANAVRVSSIFSWREKEFVGGLCRQGAPTVRQPQPDRARHPRLRRAEAPADGARLPGEEPFKVGLHAVRLVPQRPHRRGGGRGRARLQDLLWTSSSTDKVAIVTGSSRGPGAGQRAQRSSRKAAA